MSIISLQTGLKTWKKTDQLLGESKKVNFSLPEKFSKKKNANLLY